MFLIPFHFILSQKPKVFMAFGGNQVASMFLILPPHRNGHARRVLYTILNNPRSCSPSSYPPPHDAPQDGLFSLSHYQ